MLLWRIEMSWIHELNLESIGPRIAPHTAHALPSLYRGIGSSLLYRDSIELNGVWGGLQQLTKWK